jgi:hypothetical protein
MPKKRSRKTQVKRTDEWFSKYIRLRDADDNGTCCCITCGRRKNWKAVHAGHFIKRSVKELRWDEKNVHVQCPGCNTYRDGNLAIYGHEIIQRYGIKEHERMVKIKKSMKPCYVGIKKLREIEEKYKKKAQKLAEDKGIEL